MRDGKVVAETKTSCPNPDRSAIRCSSSLAGSLIFAVALIACSSPASVTLVVWQRGAAQDRYPPRKLTSFEGCDYAVLGQR